MSESPAQPAKGTRDLVKPVSGRLASRIPLRLAPADEGVTVPDPELQAILDLEKRKFLENAINMLDKRRLIGDFMECSFYD
ncbi:MAG TPA: hypothetical protein VH280_11890 [Verrucomicrobiae bacterium]|jgi:hypothetical protein|nr:hypothetical protein [Verrucomicrobiae bacterium]